MASEEQDKTEEPTPFKLEEARRKGEVPKSPDLGGVLVMGAFAVSIVVMGTALATTVARATQSTFQLAGAGPVLDAQLARWMGEAVQPVLQALLPAVFAMVVIGVAGAVLQTGFVFATEPLKPDFNRMNPSNALKRLFSIRTLWDLGKLSVKLAGLGVLLALFLFQAQRWSASFAGIESRQVPELLGEVFLWASLATLLLMLLLALMDLVFARWEYTRKLRMSRRELKDEHKRREGDPEVRAKQKRSMRELMQKLAAVARVKEADIVITNPTHYAVALRYRPNRMRAPEVVAKGRGFLSARIRAAAGKHRIRIERHPALARALYAEVGLRGAVPEALYAELAPIYRRLMQEPGSRILE